MSRLRPTRAAAAAATLASAVLSALLAAPLLLAPTAAAAQDAVIRKNLAARMPQMPKIDEIRKAPAAGLYEVRVGSEIFYTDARGDYLIQGDLLDTVNRRNLTQERVEKLTAIAFSTLNPKDAVTIVHGKGERKFAIFEDPNCGYCKRLEKDLQKLDNVTMYVYLYPILGADSVEKSHRLWCSKDAAAAWQGWMLNDRPITGAAGCDTGAVARNVELGRKYKITGTPTMVFQDGTRVAGAVNVATIEKNLAAAAK